MVNVRVVAQDGLAGGPNGVGREFKAKTIFLSKGIVIVPDNWCVWRVPLSVSALYLRRTDQMVALEAGVPGQLAPVPVKEPVLDGIGGGTGRAYNGQE